MSERQYLRIHVSEPWNFESMTGVDELMGWTTDHHDQTHDRWELHVAPSFDFHDHHVTRMLAEPRYVGEHMSRMFDAVTGFPVRLAWHGPDGWHFAFIGMVRPCAAPEQAPENETSI